MEQPETGMTRVTFFLGSHTLASLKLFEESADTCNPRIVVLEEGKDAKLNEVLKGKTTLEEHAEMLKGMGMPFPESTQKYAEFIGELRKKGVKVELLSSEGLAPSENANLRELEQRIEQELTRSFIAGNFDAAVSSRINHARLLGGNMLQRDRGIAQEIAARVKGGEWSGSILVYAGTARAQAVNILKEELKGRNIDIGSVNPSGVLGESFTMPVQQVYQPFEELVRNFTYETMSGIKVIDENRKRLLGAREVICTVMAGSTPTRSGLRGDLEALKIVNKLSYEECKIIFEEIRRRNKDDAFRYVDEYVKKREESSDSSEQ